MRCLPHTVRQLSTYLPSLIAICLTFGSLYAAEPRVPVKASTVKEQADKQTSDIVFQGKVLPFLRANCLKCHNADKKEGDITLHQLTGNVETEKTTWARIQEQLTSGAMPPETEKRPSAVAQREIIDWLKASIKADDVLSPRQGNLVPHEELFGKSAVAGAAKNFEPAPGRLWRFRPEAYFGMFEGLNAGRTDKLTQPFNVTGERGFKDYSALYSVDEATTEILVRNAEQVVATQTTYTRDDGKFKFTGGVGEFKPLFESEAAATTAQIETALRWQFRKSTNRDPSSEELASLTAMYHRNLKVGNRDAAIRTTLAVILLRADSVFRREFGQQANPQGWRMLSPTELALALSLALRNRRDDMLFNIAGKGELTTKEQIAAQLKRMLDPKENNPRLLQFFREYFEYRLAGDIFKDNQREVKHVPNQYMNDTDRLVSHILAGDKNVLQELLTTRKSFVNAKFAKNKESGKEEAVISETLNPHNDRGRVPVHTVYGVAEWPSTQPTELPDRLRMGILMQPSWLVAHSTNFDNDVVRRGKWIRERLLGGHIPELPIGVVAQVPDERHRTYRDRLTVTRDAKCWRCHQKMDDLGLPFEQFDHIGRHRTVEKVLDVEATAKNIDKKGKPLGDVLHDMPLDTSGLIADSGETALNGTMADPYIMVQKLAESPRVRQVFVRHAFRYFLGRNETVADAKTLQEADQAYVDSEGSFKALVVSVLTSDSFLYRQEPVAAK